MCLVREDIANKIEVREDRFRPAFGCAQHPKAGQNTQQGGQAGHQIQGRCNQLRV